MLKPLANPEIRRLKAAAQFLEPILKIGKAGLSDGFVQSVNDALPQHELVKIKFVEFKDQKKELAPQLADRTASYLVVRVGNVMVLHRPPAALKPGEERALPEYWARRTSSKDFRNVVAEIFALQKAL
jgi:RNA-binding protein